MGAAKREQLPERGVYLDVFEESVLSEKKNHRPLAFLISMSAELVVVSALVLIPLYYNEHLPGFEWKNVGLGLPVRPITPKPVAAQPLRQASSGPAFHQRFVVSSLPPHNSRPTAFVQMSLEAPPTQGDFNTFGAPSGSAIDLGARLQPAPPPPRPEPPAPAKKHEPIRVASTVQMAKLVKKVVPQYPPLARTARISGVVHLIGIIARDGTIRNLQLVSGHPLLTHAAMEAVQQWVYKPTLLNGEPVEVIAPIDVNFTLSDR